MFIDLQNKTFYFIPLYKIEISFYFFHKCMASISLIVQIKQEGKADAFPSHTLTKRVFFPFSASLQVKRRQKNMKRSNDELTCFTLWLFNSE